jgi:hypothetical protein
MDAKEIEVRCPCCEARLWVEATSGRVLRTVAGAGTVGPAQERDAAEPPAEDRWTSAAKKVRDRASSSADKLESALEAERTKESRFDALFDQAREKHRRGDGA